MYFLLKKNELKIKKLNYKMSKQIIYTCDYMNIFSDYREVKYKKNNIDFHITKHLNKKQDTLEFFEFFFTKYVEYSKIDKSGNFIFVLKKISNYELILNEILQKYKHIKIRFIVIETNYNISLLNKNKDDFICQYIFSFLNKKNNCILISNDQYRDRNNYINEYLKIDNCQITVLSFDKHISKNTMELNIEKTCAHSIINMNYTRSSVPKNKLQYIL